MWGKLSSFSFSRKHKKKEADQLEIMMENVVLKRSDEVKYLGVTVYQQLTWRQHIERVRKKCLSLLYKIKGTLSLKLRKQHFESFI